MTEQHHRLSGGAAAVKLGACKDVGSEAPDVEHPESRDQPAWQPAAEHGACQADGSGMRLTKGKLRPIISPRRIPFLVAACRRPP